MKKREYISLEDARHIGESLYVDWDQVDIVQFRWELTGIHRSAAKAPASGPHFVKVILTHIKDFPDYFSRLAKLRDEFNDHQVMSR
ncbi:MAG: hypothetical protein ABIJ65_14750 [Chloroflexota bacterium]